MSNYRKPFWGSLLAFIMATSCCWLSSLLIWLGGATAIGVLANWINNIQLLLIILGIVLSAIAIWRYVKRA